MPPGRQPPSSGAVADEVRVSAATIATLPAPTPTPTATRVSRARATVTRRLALNACDSCRQRKTKCDENHPACGRCQRLELTCTYGSNGSTRKPVSSPEIIAQLASINAKLDSLLSLLASATSEAASVARSSPVLQQNATSSLSPALPVHHSTAAHHLLSWPCSRVYLTQSALRYPIQLEVQRKPMPNTTDVPQCLSSHHAESNWPTELSLSQLQLLTSLYFRHFHPQYPIILDEQEFYARNLGRALRTDFEFTLDTALLFLVLALGSIAAYENGHSEWATRSVDRRDANAGLGFYNLAVQICNSVHVMDWKGVQCRLLMGLFHSANLRVYDQWTMVQDAASKILLLLSMLTTPVIVRKDVVADPLVQTRYRGTPSLPSLLDCLHTRKILSEFDFTPSGLGRLESVVPLPVFHGSVNETPTDETQMLFFLALISCRRLLNRIHLNLYAQETSPSTVLAPSPTDCPPFVQYAVIEELDRQLEAWKTCLPEALQFSLDSFSLEGNVQISSSEPQFTHDKLLSHLTARYYAAKFIIYRPFLWRALHRSPNGRVPLHVKDQHGARTALDAGLKCVSCSGILASPVALLFNPMNTLRSIYSISILMEFVLKDVDIRDLLLPENWEIVYRFQDSWQDALALTSPVIVRDVQLLQALR